MLHDPRHAIPAEDRIQLELMLRKHRRIDAAWRRFLHVLVGAVFLIAALQLARLAGFIPMGALL